MICRANILIRDHLDDLWLYRHSDGHPEVTLESLKKFINRMFLHDENEFDLTFMNHQKKIGRYLRLLGIQSAGWLILQGREEFKPLTGLEWKIGAYEPTTCLHGDVDFLYVLDFSKQTIAVFDTLKTDSFDVPHIMATEPVAHLTFLEIQHELGDPVEVEA